MTSWTKRDYVLLWVFASIDKQSGFCLDLALEYAKLFGADEVAALLRTESIAQISQAKQALLQARINGTPTLLGRVKRKLQRELKRVLWPGRGIG